MENNINQKKIINKKPIIIGVLFILSISLIIAGYILNSNTKSTNNSTNTDKNTNSTNAGEKIEKITNQYIKYMSIDGKKIYFGKTVGSIIEQLEEVGTLTIDNSIGLLDESGHILYLPESDYNKIYLDNITGLGVALDLTLKNGEKILIAFNFSGTDKHIPMMKAEYWLLMIDDIDLTNKIKTDVKLTLNNGSTIEIGKSNIEKVKESLGTDKIFTETYNSLSFTDMQKGMYNFEYNDNTLNGFSIIQTDNQKYYDK